MIVNLWMSWMSILAKKTKTPRKAKNNNLRNTKYQNVNQRGSSFTFNLKGGGGLPLSRMSVTPLSMKTQSRTQKISPKLRA